MNISIIIPVYNEEECIERVLDEIREKNPDAEIIAVTDGSTDKTLEKLQKQQDVQILSFEKNIGKGFAICEGLKHATHEICILIDGDGQYDPSDIPLFAEKLHDVDLVCGVRTNRQDRMSSIIVSKIANYIRRKILKDKVRDTGCGLKAIRKSCSHILPAFEGTHRFIPAFFIHAGLRVTEMPAQHHPRLAGKTKYTHLGRAWRGIIDLVRVSFLLKSINPDLVKVRPSMIYKSRMK